MIVISALISGCGGGAPSSSMSPTTTASLARLVDASTARPTTTTSAAPATTTAALPMTTTSAVAPPVAPTTTVAVAPPPAPAVIPAAPQSSVSYASCADAKAAGAAPIYQGEPGYSTKLDRDKDGIACDK
ncbi:MULTISPECIES: excalibur calcium-binding domain-containing protein [unclassified Rhodococcus (in: high G+C Gram-positive bacteria)]|uniref:excalibur calcium-binding domain-containing protein n=1 Tax=unclassified Rhodococcus (in: high G+C Gram-positive bacteria) TaxID=192944 RepID=UPI00031EFFB1|nr:excalibur calcium-binding domain-containing protein [Rhodococcus sp. DK17]